MTNSAHGWFVSVDCLSLADDRTAAIFTFYPSCPSVVAFAYRAKYAHYLSVKSIPRPFSYKTDRKPSFPFHFHNSTFLSQKATNPALLPPLPHYFDSTSTLLPLYLHSNNPLSSKRREQLHLHSSFFFKYHQPLTPHFPLGFHPFPTTGRPFTLGLLLTSRR